MSLLVAVLREALAVSSSKALARCACQLPDGDPTLRCVTMMCAYALEVAQESVPGPYDDQRARQYARSALVDRDEWALYEYENDA